MEVDDMAEGSTVIGVLVLVAGLAVLVLAALFYLGRRDPRR
ncbi:hypothetical protein SMC26_33785 [Actinomadura fulvescens]|uniref:LPXTG cell wall anchor domain-containing protein n=1 Tax=Actinomadura fulvescens TaxID=46160 RepID=A0ABN3PLC0_9ACTN